MKITATGNPDLTGIVNGTFYQGTACAQFKGQTLVSDTNVFIGGCCTFDSDSRQWIQESYKDGYGEWAQVVKIPAGTLFTVDVINDGDLRNVAEVKVNILGKSAPVATV